MKFYLQLIIIIFLISFIFINYFPTVNYIEKDPETHFYDTANFIVSHENYLSKIVIVNGVITDVVLGSPYISVVLDSTLHFSFETSKIQATLGISDTLLVKARFEGFDDIFEQYIFTDCTVVK